MKDNHMEEIIVILKYLKNLKIEGKKLILIINKQDLHGNNKNLEIMQQFQTLDIPYFLVSSLTNTGISYLLEKFIELSKQNIFNN